MIDILMLLALVSASFTAGFMSCAFIIPFWLRHHGYDIDDVIAGKMNERKAR